MLINYNGESKVIKRICELLNTMSSVNFEVVEELPTTDISTSTIYLVPKTTAGQDNIYDEYINTDGTSQGWELIGDTEVDLSNYYTKAQTDALIEELDETGESSISAGKTIASWSESDGHVSITTQDISITKSQISNFSHTHGNITNAGALQTNDVAVASGDKLVVTDSSNSNKVARTSTSFDGSTTNKALTPKGTFEDFVQDSSYVHTDSNYTATEKTKLSGIAEGAEVNVQSDWSQATTTADDYIKNKPQNLVQDANYVHTDNNFTTTLKNKLDGIATGAEVNQNAFSNVKVGDSTVGADSKTDTIELVAGSNVTLTPDTTNDKVTIASTVPLATSNVRGGMKIGYSESGNKYAVQLSSEKAYVEVPWTDTHVTESANHYTPATVSGQDVTASASGATAAWSIDVVKGITLNTDGKGHITGASVTSGKIPANPSKNSTITVQVNSTDFQNNTFTLNQSSAKTIDIPVTKSTVGLDNVPNVTTNDQTPTFSQASTRTNISSGEKLSVILGKVMKWFADLKDLAFIAKDGSSSTKYLQGDGTWQAFPTIPTVNNATLTVNQNSTSKGTFTANASSDVTVDLTDANVTQTASSTNAEYRVLFSDGANNDTETKGVKKDGDFTYNPSTNILTVSKIVASSTQDASGVADNMPALRVGKINGTHLEFDGNEIISKSNGTTPGPLYINGDGANTTISNMLFKPQKVMNPLVTGTGTAGSTSSDTPAVYKPALWTFDTGNAVAAGDMITIKIPVEGHANGVLLSIDNGTTYKPCIISGTDILTTHYGNGIYITLLYESTVSVNAYPATGGTEKISMTGCWRVLNYRDQSVTQTNTTTNANYRVLFSNSANNTTQISGTRKSAKLLFNPSTGNLSATQLNGNTIPTGTGTLALTSDITDEKVKQIKLPDTNTRCIAFAYSSDGGTQETDSVYKHGSITASVSEGTTSAIGSSNINLGNSAQSGVAGNCRGVLTLYGSTNGKTSLMSKAPQNQNYIVYLPTDAGTLALDNQVSTSAKGLCPTAPNDSNKFFRGDASWDYPDVVTALTSSNSAYAITGSFSKVGKVVTVSGTFKAASNADNVPTNLPKFLNAGTTNILPIQIMQADSPWESYVGCTLYWQSNTVKISTARKSDGKTIAANTKLVFNFSYVAEDY